MKFEIKSKVYIDGVGVFTYTHTQEFDDHSNVFGRVLEYHRYMQKLFPKHEFELISAKEA